MTGHVGAIKRLAREPAVLGTPESGAADFVPVVASAPVGAGWWLNLLCLALLGYALFGKGFAYLGVPPLFVGEAVLVCGIGYQIRSGRWQGLLGVPAVWFLLLLGTWGTLRTWPDVAVYGADALRDAALWGYAAFAILVFGSILARPARLQTLLRHYRWFSAVFLLCVPVLWIPYRFLSESIPHWPWGDVPVVVVKGGDMMVHLCGILAFAVAGIGELTTVQSLLLTFGVVLIGTRDRAGLLTFLAVFALCFVLRPRARPLRHAVGWGLAILVVLAVTDIRIKLPQRERDMSFQQLMANVISPFSEERVADLEETKQWRLDWWNDIFGYTLYGRYFWDGKGFGINLADDDGYQVEDDGSLRNPHNGHYTMLARGGVPGFVLWILAQASWGCGIVAGYLRSRRLGQCRWNGLFLFLFAYWLAFMLNASFDVFLEGPMGGIWFWTVYGVGLAAMSLYRHSPEVLGPDALPTALPGHG